MIEAALKKHVSVRDDDDDISCGVVYCMMRTQKLCSAASKRTLATTSTTPTTPPTKNLIDLPKPGGMNIEDFRLFAELGTPFSSIFPYQIVHMRNNHMRMRLPFKECYVGNPAIPALHGGVVSSLIDQVGGFCSWSMLSKPLDRVSTTNLTVNYFNPAPKAALIGEARVINTSKKFFVTDITVYTEDDPDVKLAAGRATFYRYSGPEEGTKEADERLEELGRYLEVIRPKQKESEEARRRGGGRDEGASRE
jgi:uncharacterized protein (TIGR00369 family)